MVDEVYRYALNYGGPGNTMVSAIFAIHDEYTARRKKHRKLPRRRLVVVEVVCRTTINPLS